MLVTVHDATTEITWVFSGTPKFDVHGNFVRLEHVRFFAAAVSVGDETLCINGDHSPYMRVDERLLQRYGEEIHAAAKQALGIS